MHSSATLAGLPDSRVVVDLIGDLDTTLGTLVATTLAELVSHGTSDVHVTTKHVSAISNDGLAALERAVLAARADGIAVAVHAGTRKMRSAFARSAMVSSEDHQPMGRSRHLMLARHALASPMP